MSNEVHETRLLAGFLLHHFPIKSNIVPYNLLVFDGIYVGILKMYLKKTI